MDSSIEFAEHKRELMLAWRYALLAYLDEAIKANVMKSDLNKDELGKILETERNRDWNIVVGSLVSKKIVVDHIGRYIRKPPEIPRSCRKMDL